MIRVNEQRVLLLTIQFDVSDSFTLSLNVKQFYLTNRKDPIRCYCSVRVDLVAMAMKGYFIFLKAPGLEPHHQII